MIRCEGCGGDVECYWVVGRRDDREGVRVGVREGVRERVRDDGVLRGVREELRDWERREDRDAERVGLWREC